MVEEEAPRGQSQGPQWAVDKGVTPRAERGGKVYPGAGSFHTSCPAGLITARTGGQQVFCFPNGRFDDC